MAHSQNEQRVAGEDGENGDPLTDCTEGGADPYP
jgi:hypothetical protein